MKNIFIFTASNQKAQANLDISIKNPIKTELVFNSFETKYHDHLKKIIDISEGFYAWGATPAESGKKEKNKFTWNKMAPADYVITVFSSTYHFVATVIDKFDNIRFAQSVWGNKYDDNRKNNPTWQYMYFLTKPKKINVPVSSLNNYLSSSYLGFSAIGQKKIEKINKEFSSTDAFIKQNLIEKADTVKSRYLPTKKDFEIAYATIAVIGDEIAIDKLLDRIGINAIEAGHKLHENWRIITERKIIYDWPS